MLTRAPSDRAFTMSVVCSTVREFRPGSAPAVGRTVTSAQFEMPSIPVCQARDQSRARRWKSRLESFARSTCPYWPDQTRSLTSVTKGP